MGKFFPAHELYLRTLSEGKANSIDGRANLIDVVIDLISCKDQANPISFPWSIKACSIAFDKLVQRGVKDSDSSGLGSSRRRIILSEG